MTESTHIHQINGVNRGALRDDIRPFPDQIRFSLNQMNGSSCWAYSLRRASEGADLSEDFPFSEEYLQCAGTAEAMTVEVRTLDRDGNPHQYTVGKSGGDDPTAEPTEVIRWDDGRQSVTIYPNEAFTADEAADVFYTYFRTDKVAEPYVLRELDLTPPSPEERMAVEISRLDAHPGDQDGLTKAVEGSSDLMLSDLLATVLEPFLDEAPRGIWVCRGKSRGRWRQFAEVVTFGPPERLGSRLLVRDEPLRSFVGGSETTLQVACRPTEHAYSADRPGRGTATRPLTFGDDKDNEQKWLPGSTQSALDAFFEFIGEHGGDGNWSFYIEDEESGDGLVLLFETRTICRITTESGEAEYRLVTQDGDYRTLVNNFIRGGITALDLHGPWLPDVASLTRAMHRREFDGSPLRRTHPRELRRRLEILTSVDGREPNTVRGVTHYCFGTDRGDAVNAWFTADGRGLVVTFDHTSALGSASDARENAALYDGVPADLLALARDVPETVITRNVPHPDGGTLVAATGIACFSGPCALSDGLVSRLQEAEVGFGATGIERLLEVFLETEDFTPAAVAETVSWWSAGEIAKGFTAAAAREQKVPQRASLDSGAGNRFREIWADTGRYDRWGVHYVLFDSCTREEAGVARDELLRLIQILGLERVDAPPEAATGEVWVRTDPRIDAVPDVKLDGGLDMAANSEQPVTSAESSLLEAGIRALTFHWSGAERQAFRSPPYPLPTELSALIGRLEAALPADKSLARPDGAYLPSSAHHGQGVMVRFGLPRVLVDLLAHGVLTLGDGARLVEAVEAADLPVKQRELVARDLLLRLVEVNLMTDDVAAAEQVAARMSTAWTHLGWREIAAYHAAHGHAATFFRNWGHYDARQDRTGMVRLKTKLVQAVAAREGWRAAIEVCGDTRIGDGFTRHAFEPPAYGYDDLVTVFGGEAAGVLREADELHCLVAAAVAESRPRPVGDHRGVEDLLARISALDPTESKEAMRTRDHLLSTLYMAIGSEDTLARLRAQIRTPRLRKEAMRLFAGPQFGIDADRDRARPGGAR